MVVFAALAAPLVRLLSLFVRDVYPGDDWLSVSVARLVNGGGAREAEFGLLLTMMGLGAVAGVLALKLVPRWYPKHHFIPLSIACSGVTIVLFSATSSFPLAAVLVFLCGVFWLWAFNSAFAAMQVLVDDAMRGRVLAVCNVAVFGAMPLGSLAAGALGELVAGRVGQGAGVQLGVGTMGAALALAGIAMLTWRTPEVDGLAPGEAGHQRRPGLLAGITAGAHRPTANGVRTAAK
jgi:predicted MFS family arabinose efflux permease